MGCKKEFSFTSWQTKEIKACKRNSYKLEKAIKFLGLGSDNAHSMARVFLTSLYVKYLKHKKEKEVFEVMPLREWVYFVPEEEKDFTKFKKEWLTGAAEIVNFVLEKANLKPYVVDSKKCETAKFSLMVKLK